MSQHPPTRTTSTASPAAPGGGIDFKTLWVTAVSSAAAAYVTSKVWAPGTLAAAAFTPVLVAVIREGLAKSSAVVARAVPVKGVVRSASPEGPAASRAEPVLADDPAPRVAQPGEIAYHGSSRRARNWRVAVITGLLGFVIAAVVFTVPELVAGGSASGGGRDTTLFGGGTHRDRPTPAVTTTTRAEPAKPATPPPAQETVTVAPETVTTPAPATTTLPAQTTPVPTTTIPPG